MDKGEIGAFIAGILVVVIFYFAYGFYLTHFPPHEIVKVKMGKYEAVIQEQIDKVDLELRIARGEVEDDSNALNSYFEEEIEGTWNGKE